ncbi:hypothetical protein FIBSPDRAFT_963309 [Athelia psychrophila]|uniref:G-protein coupled receptors family 1 profile domain-containing protein n=1 Tax=Athelia psychrophila TaxID=1759441 RepID=A0A165Z4U0_9AGAM|nr:hypothetical protein FIBSPDRAFT_963309 [Fibularhizoctonia sp. CBS 109695]
MVSSTLPAINALMFKGTAYISVTQLTAYLYDWLLSISEEHRIMETAGITWPIAIYLLSRITAATVLVLIAIFIFAPTGHCAPLVALLVTCAATRTITTSFLFLLRIRAVYLHSRCITTLFGIMWLITVTLSIVTDASIRAGPLTDTQYCINFQIQHPTYPSISTFTFDTFAFIAISYRLATDAATEQSWRARLQSVVTGKGLFSISRALMISGVLYYLAILFFFSVILSVMVSPLVPTSSHYALNTSYMAFTNIMACRVFRGVAPGMMEYSPATAGLSSTRIAAAFELSPAPLDHSAIS